MDILLNIGLARPDGGHSDASTVLRTLRARGFHHTDAKLHVSNTEETVVAKLESTDAPIRQVRQQLYYVANDLGQDCIAVLFDDAAGEPEGALIGPRAAAWGEFDPAQFLLLDGTRLG